jgi:hypothetical protein
MVYRVDEKDGNYLPAMIIKILIFAIDYAGYFFHIPQTICLDACRPPPRNSRYSFIAERILAV